MSSSCATTTAGNQAELLLRQIEISRLFTCLVLTHLFFKASSSARCSGKLSAAIHGPPESCMSFSFFENEEGLVHDSEPGDLEFSPDGASTAYVVASDYKCIVVRNGSKFREHDTAIGAVFSPDGSRFAYVAKEGGKVFVVLDGENQKPYEDIEPNSLVFSPNGERFVYSGAASGKNLVVIDSEETQLYDQTLSGPGCPAFSPNSERIAYGAEQNGRWRAVVDGKHFGEVDSFISWHHAARGLASRTIFAYSSDSAQVVYVGEIGRRKVVVLNGKRLEQELSEFTHRPVFSPNGKRLAYAGIVEEKPLVIIDGMAYQPEHQVIGSSLFFSPDSVHLAYMAARGSEQFVVVDGLEGESFGPLRLDEGDIVFDSPSDLHYLVMKDWHVYLVHEKIEANE